jgi:hypothetical protein
VEVKSNKTHKRNDETTAWILRECCTNYYDHSYDYFLCFLYEADKRYNRKDLVFLYAFWERQWKKYTQRDALDSYSESIRFESRSERRLS